MELIRVASFEAHGRTCLLSREKIGLGWSRGISHYTIDKFKEMVSVLSTFTFRNFVVVGERGSVDHCGRENDSNYLADY